MDNRNPQRSTAGANRLRTRVAPLPGPATGDRASDHGIGGFGRTRAAMPAAMPHDGAAAWAVNTAASSRKGPRSSFAFGSPAENRRLGIGRPAGQAIRWDAWTGSSWTLRRTGPHLAIFLSEHLLSCRFVRYSARARRRPIDRETRSHPLGARMGDRGSPKRPFSARIPFTNERSRCGPRIMRRPLYGTLAKRLETNGGAAPRKVRPRDLGPWPRGFGLRTAALTRGRPHRRRNGPRRRPPPSRWPDPSRSTRAPRRAWTRPSW